MQRHWSHSIILAVFLILTAMPQPSKAAGVHARSASEADGIKTFTGTVERPEMVATSFIPIPQTSDQVLSGVHVTLLDGTVLIAGGQVSLDCFSSEIFAYDPVQRMIVVRGMLKRSGDTSRYDLLLDGRVLIHRQPDLCSQGSVADTEVFDPTTNTSRVITDTSTLPPVVVQLKDRQLVNVENRSITVYAPGTQTSPSTGTLAFTHTSYTLTALQDHRILIADGSGTTPSEVFDPMTGQTTTVGTMTSSRTAPETVLLEDDRVLIIGGYVSGGELKTAELFDPATGIFTATGSMHEIRGDAAAAITPESGKVLVSDGRTTEVYDTATGMFHVQTVGVNVRSSVFSVGTDHILGVSGDRLNRTSGALYNYAPTNTLTGTLSLPTPVINLLSFKVGIEASSTGAPITEYALRYEQQPMVVWQPLDNNPLTTTVTFALDGKNKAISLYLRDANGQQASIVTGSVNIDIHAPTTIVTAIGTYSPPAVVVRWYGNDNLSRTLRYAVEVRVGESGSWTRVSSAITTTKTTYQGSDGQHLFFRVRATDEAGNVEPWPTTFDTQTTVDNGSPYGGIDVSFVGTSSIELLLSAIDQRSGVTSMRVSYASTFGQTAWEPYARSKILSRIGQPQGCLQVAAQFRDAVGNSSPIYRINVPDTGCVDDQHQVFLPLVQR